MQVEPALEPYRPMLNSGEEKLSSIILPPTKCLSGLNVVGSGNWVSSWVIALHTLDSDSYDAALSNTYHIFINIIDPRLLHQ